MNTAAFRIAQARYDHAEDPRFAAEAAEDAIDAAVEREMLDASAVYQVLWEGLAKSNKDPAVEALAALFVAYQRDGSAHIAYQLAGALQTAVGDAIERMVQSGEWDR